MNGSRDTVATLSIEQNVNEGDTGSQYRLQVHKNLFLDAADKKHFEGRFIAKRRERIAIQDQRKICCELCHVHMLFNWPHMGANICNT